MQGCFLILKAILIVTRQDVTMISLCMQGCFLAASLPLLSLTLSLCLIVRLCRLKLSHGGEAVLPLLPAAQAVGWAAGMLMACQELPPWLTRVRDLP